MSAKVTSGAADAGLGEIGVAPTQGELSPVRGPSAFGGPARRFVDLLWLSSAIEFRARYATTFLGYIWTIARPLLFFGLIFLVMRGILGFGKNIPNYGPMLILNLVLFQYFQEGTSRALRSVTSKEGLVRKMQFPRIVIPLSVSLTAGFTLLFNLLAVFPLFLITGLQPRWSWLGLIVIIFGLALLTTGLSLILSVAFVRSEDVGEAWLLLARMLFYASPILYPIERVPESGPFSRRRESTVAAARAGASVDDRPVSSNPRPGGRTLARPRHPDGFDHCHLRVWPVAVRPRGAPCRRGALALARKPCGPERVG